MDKEKNNKIYADIRETSLFDSIYIDDDGENEKTMIEILGNLNTVIKCLWRIVELADNSELLNQHSEYTLNDFENKAIDFEDIRSDLFKDSFNYDRIVTLGLKQLPEMEARYKEYQDSKNKENDNG